MMSEQQAEALFILGLLSAILWAIRLAGIVEGASEKTIRVVTRLAIVTGIPVLLQLFNLAIFG